MSRKVKSAVLWTVIAVLVIGVSMGGTYAIYEAVRTGTAMKAEKRISEQKERENEEKARKEEERKKKEAERLSQTAETAREKLNTALGLLGKSVIRSRNEETLRRSAEAASSESDISRMDDITRLIAGLYSYSGGLAEGTLTTLMSLHSDDASYYDEQTSAQRTESAERIKALISDGDYRKAYAEETSLKKALDAYDQEKKNEEEQKRKAESFLSKSGTFEDGTIYYSDRDSFMKAYASFASQQEDAVYQKSFAPIDWDGAQTKGRLVSPEGAETKVYAYVPDVRKIPAGSTQSQQTETDGQTDGTVQSEQETPQQEDTDTEA